MSVSFYSVKHRKEEKTIIFVAEKTKQKDKRTIYIYPQHSITVAITVHSSKSESGVILSFSSFIY